MGLFLVQLAYNVSPASAEYQSKALLKYASPDAYGALSNAASVAARQMKADGSSTMFLPRAYLLDTTPNVKAVAFIGDLQTFVTNNLVSTRGVAIVVRFKYEGGRLYVDQMKEARQDDPFETKFSGSNAH
jgi:type IV conjugative transfer system protein TraE